MTQEQYDKSIQTGYLQLTNWQKFNHFGLVVFLFFMPLTVLVFFFSNYYNGIYNFQYQEIYVIIIPTIIGLLTYRIQKNRLKFKTLVSQVRKEHLAVYMEQLCREWNWTPYFNNENIFIAKTNRSFFSGGWGERVTVLFDNNNIFINSICDPDKRSSMTSMGHNGENVQAVIDLINNVNKVMLP